MSTYRLSRDGALQPISAAVANGQGSSCWIELSGNGKYAFAANTGSGTTSSYRIGRDGSLSLLDPAAATPGAGATDMIESDGCSSPWRAALTRSRATRSASGVR